MFVGQSLILVIAAVLCVVGPISRSNAPHIERAWLLKRLMPESDREANEISMLARESSFRIAGQLIYTESVERHQHATDISVRYSSVGFPAGSVRQAQPDATMLAARLWLQQRTISGPFIAYK